MLTAYATARDHTSSRQWTGLMIYRYESNAELEKELLSRYFSPEWQAKFASMKAQKDQKLAQYQQQREAAQENARAIRHEQSMRQWGPIIGTGAAIVYLLLCFVAAKFAFSSKLEILDTPVPMLRSDDANYKLNISTGTVIEQTRNVVSHTHVSGGYNNQPVSSRVVSVTHREFFLKTESGREESFHLTANLAEVAMREGHQVSVMWPIRTGAKSGSFILLKNHSTGESAYDDRTIKKICAAISGRHVPLIILCVMTCIFGLAIYLVAWLAGSSNRANKLRGLLEQKAIPLLDRLALRDH